MGNDEEDLRATSASIVVDAEHLAAIEVEKQSLDVNDPRMVELSREAGKLAKALVPKTAAETELVAAIQG